MNESTVSVDTSFETIDKDEKGLDRMINAVKTKQNMSESFKKAKLQREKDEETVKKMFKRLTTYAESEMKEIRQDFDFVKLKDDLLGEWCPIGLDDQIEHQEVESDPFTRAVVELAPLYIDIEDESLYICHLMHRQNVLERSFQLGKPRSMGKATASLAYLGNGFLKIITLTSLEEKVQTETFQIDENGRLMSVKTLKELTSVRFYESAEEEDRRFAKLGKVEAESEKNKQEIADLKKQLQEKDDKLTRYERELSDLYARDINAALRRDSPPSILRSINGLWACVQETEWQANLSVEGNYFHRHYIHDTSLDEELETTSQFGVPVVHPCGAITLTTVSPNDDMITTTLEENGVITKTILIYLVDGYLVVKQMRIGQRPVDIVLEKLD